MAKLQHFFTADIPPKKYVNACTFKELQELKNLVSAKLNQFKGNTFKLDTELTMAAAEKEG